MENKIKSMTIKEYWEHERALEIKLFGHEIGEPPIEPIIEQPKSDYKPGFEIIPRKELSLKEKKAIGNWYLGDTINEFKQRIPSRDHSLYV